MEMLVIGLVGGLVYALIGALFDKASGKGKK